jgi:protocatechuate 3,4-dioxygenase beta subunit
MTAPEPEPVSAEIAQLLELSPACRAWAEQDQGPFHRDDEPIRRDIAEDRPGAPLTLGIRITGPDDTPLRGAGVEIWHCDALGRYSGFAPPEPAPTVAQARYLPDATFLRGRQITDAAGMVEFRTIYPGWYPGRTVHIHAIVHVGGAPLTSQLYFPEPINNTVLATEPYRSRPGRDTTNDTDTIFPTGGTPAVLDVTGSTSGYRAGICLVLPSASDL